MADVWDLVHVITKLELGGAQLATLYELEHSTATTGSRSLVFGPGGMLESEARAIVGLRCVEVPALGRRVDPILDARAIIELAARLRALRTPGHRLLVHTHSSKAGILGRWAARAAGADLVVHTIHGFGHGDPAAPRPARALFLAAEQLAAHITDGFTADSAANLAQARREAILGDVPGRVVRCGIDVAEFAEPERDRSAVRRELGATDRDEVVLGLFCLKPQKNPRAFVEVASRVLRERPRAVFWIAGDGELRARVESLVNESGVGERLRLLGWRRDVPELLHASDLILHTALWEGLPQVFPQAMAAKRAIVATRVDGASEAIEDGVSGLLHDVGDVHGMAAAVCELLGDAQRRASMGERGSAAVSAFSRERMVEDLDRFYVDLMAAPSRGGRARQLAGQARHWLESLTG